MKKNELKKFAIWARRQMVSESYAFFTSDVKAARNILCFFGSDNRQITDEFQDIVESFAYSGFFTIITEHYLKKNNYCDYRKNPIPVGPNLKFARDFIKNSLVYKEIDKKISEDNWKDIQCLGWLHQYYQAEKKDEVFAALKKNVKISEANISTVTQLFTREWIVKYMVQNSLGRFWLERHPNPELEKKWEYYVPQAEQLPKIGKNLQVIGKTNAGLLPEDLKVIDPCCGCGNILDYVFDLLMDIYISEGYPVKTAIKLIINENIYGLDIDPRVIYITRFSLQMKAREYYPATKEFIETNVYCISESHPLSEDFLNHISLNNQMVKENLIAFLERMKEANVYGSLLNFSDIDLDLIAKQIIAFNPELGNDGYFCWLRDRFNAATLLNSKYNVVVTNPPYMAISGMSPNLRDFVKENYPDSKGDLFASFMERGMQLVDKNGYNSMVTMQSWMFLSSFAKMRTKLFKKYDLCNLMHMENMVMDIAFGTAVSIFRNSFNKGYKGTYHQIKYKDIVNDEPFEFPVKGNRFAQLSTETFFKVPGNLAVYWITPKLLEAYTNGVVGDKYSASVGLQTGDNKRFLKYWFEVPFDSICFNRSEDPSYSNVWYPHPKGGAYRKWYGNLEYVVNWQHGGQEITKFTKNSFYVDKFAVDALCWSHTTSGDFSGRIYSKNSIPNLENPVFFCEPEKINFYLAYFNSNLANYLLNMLNSTLHYNIADLMHLPLPKEECNSRIHKLVAENIDLARKDWDSFELSWDFKKHPLIRAVSTIEEAFKLWEKDSNKAFKKLKANEEEINAYFISLFGLEKELTADVEDKAVSIRKAELKRDIKSFISYGVGCVLGRYSLKKAGLINCGKKPYKELSVDDVTQKFIDFVSDVYGTTHLEENLIFIAKALKDKGQPREVLKQYFAKDFYKDHCKTYKKRPIYPPFLK